MHHLDIRDWNSIRLRIGESTRRATYLDPEQSSHPSSNPPSSQVVGITRESKEVGVQMPTKTTMTLLYLHPLRRCTWKNSMGIMSPRQACIHKTDSSPNNPMKQCGGFCQIPIHPDMNKCEKTSRSFFSSVEGMDPRGQRSKLVSPNPT